MLFRSGSFVAENFSLPGIGGPDGPACVSIRPQDVTLGLATGGSGATVEESEFLGGVVRYRLKMGGQTLVVDVPHRREAVPHAVGATVGLIVDPRQVTVLR